MRLIAPALGLSCTALLAVTQAVADVPADAAAAPPAAAAQDRLMLSADGSHLSGTGGGGGAQVAWLHDLDAAKTAAALEYQTLAGGDWVVGTLSGARACNARSASMRDCSLNAEAHLGAGRAGSHSFRYTILAGGFNYALSRRLSAQLEDRYVDVDSSRGHLPKASLTLLPGSRALTTLSYAHSLGGNLATELLVARIDLYEPRWRYLAGAVYGSAAPAVVNLQSAPAAPGRTLKEAFVGCARSMSRGELQLLGDYIGLGASRRFTLTLGYTLALPP